MSKVWQPKISRVLGQMTSAKLKFKGAVPKFNTKPDVLLSKGLHSWCFFPLC